MDLFYAVTGNDCGSLFISRHERKGNEMKMNVYEKYGYDNIDFRKGICFTKREIYDYLNLYAISNDLKLDNDNAEFAVSILWFMSDVFIDMGRIDKEKLNEEFKIWE